MPPRKDSFGYGVTLPPITGRQWYATTVRNVLDRAGGEVVREAA